MHPVKKLFTRQQFLSQNKYLHGCRTSSINFVINTAAVSHAKRYIYTAAVHSIYLHGSHFFMQKVYIHGCCASNINLLCTRQRFLMPKPFIYIAVADPVKNIYTATESVDKSNGRKTCFVESKSTSVRKFSILISTECNLFLFLW